MFTGLRSAEQAAATAYDMAGVGPKDIDVAEVHDCFTIAEIMAYENLGFAWPGEGPELIRSKQTYKEGSIPVNVDGGLLSKGHPTGELCSAQAHRLKIDKKRKIIEKEHQVQAAQDWMG